MEGADGLFEIGPDRGRPDPGTGSLAGAAHASAPLAVRMRPRTLDELVGQEQLRSPGSPLRQLIEGGQSLSLLLWGPPGTGKTTIAGILSQQTDRRFVEVSAVAAGVKEVRAAIDSARSELVRGGRETVLFVDEVHRFSKAQQDALLPGVENRWVTLVAATTENPFFSVISPLLSRSLLLRLESLTDDHVREVVASALADERGLAGEITVADDALDHLVRLAGGDARRALTYLEAAAGAARSRGSTDDRPGDGRDRRRPGRGALRPTGRPALRRDQRLHQVDPRLRRRRRAALPGPDDRGGGGPAVHRPAAGDPGQRGHRPGRPDGADDGRGRCPGGPAHRHARGPAQPRPGHHRAGGGSQVQRRDHRHRGGQRRRARRQDRTRARRTCATPTTPARRSSGTARPYTYSHDEPYGIAEQQYAPDAVLDARYYQPTSLGAEAAVKERWERIRRLVRGETR